MDGRRTADKTYLPGSCIEMVNPKLRPGPVRFALFDFDGTISLIREGWQQTMIALMVEVLAEACPDQSEDALRAWAAEFIDRTTGVQTIYQMIELRDEVARRGGLPLDPEAYKREYLDRLWARIKHRVAGLKEGRTSRGQMIVAGAEDLLKNLRSRGVVSYLASGTDIEYVRDEACALGVDIYFDGGVHGALPDYKNYSKAKVIGQILGTHDLRGSDLVVFGDGFVEIENAKAVGGIAVGVATDEVRRAGINEWKRVRLIQAGADIVVADFREQELLVDYLLAEDNNGVSRV